MLRNQSPRPSPYRSGSPDKVELESKEKINVEGSQLLNLRSIITVSSAGKVLETKPIDNHTKRTVHKDAD